MDDTTSPLITLSTPSNGQAYTSGQSIRISGSVTDNDRIAEIHVHVNNLATNTLLLDVHLYPGSSDALFDQSITATAGTDYKIQIIAIDRYVNQSVITAQVSCN